jgi:hypothetical protein
MYKIEGGGKSISKTTKKAAPGIIFLARRNELHT